MKTILFVDSNGTYCGYRGQEWVFSSFGSEPIQSASSEDIAEHQKNGSGLYWIESAARVLLNSGTVKRF